MWFVAHVNWFRDKTHHFVCSIDVDVEFAASWGCAAFVRPSAARPLSAPFFTRGWTFHSSAWLSPQGPGDGVRTVTVPQPLPLHSVFGFCPHSLVCCLIAEVVFFFFPTCFSSEKMTSWLLVHFSVLTALCFNLFCSLYKWKSNLWLPKSWYLICHS